MKIRVREQAGTDAVRKFDYQMAVALDYLLSEIDNDAIILIETLEDFAIFRNHGSGNETIDVFQVKTKDSGLYAKTAINKDNVIGKIILTDYYFDSQSDTLNIICNTPLKGTSTEHLDNFVFEKTLTKKELENLKSAVTYYLREETDFSGIIDPYWGKLIYIKSSLPFSGKEDRYSETLIGKTNATIARHLNDENHSINPQIVFNTLKLLIDKQRKSKILETEIDVEDAISKKGIRSSMVKEVIDQAVATNHLTKNEILQHASRIFNPVEYLAIKSEYPTFLSYRSNLADKAFRDAVKIINSVYLDLTQQEAGSLDDIIRNTAQNCTNQIPYYSLAVIQIITIVIVYS